jgi:hypothetical protein
MAGTAPDPAAIGTSLVSTLGGTVVDTYVSLAPVTVPITLALAVVAGVKAKLSLNKRKAGSIV